MRKFAYAKKRLKALTFFLLTAVGFAAVSFDSLDNLFIFKLSNSSLSSLQTRNFITKRIYAIEENESLKVELKAKNSYLDSYKLFHLNSIDEKLDGIVLDAEEKKDLKTFYSFLKAKDGSFNLTDRTFLLSDILFTRSQDLPLAPHLLQSKASQALLNFSENPIKLRAFNFHAEIVDHD